MADSPPRSAWLSWAVWALLPLFVGWQLVINTGTTIITFLVVFLLQRSQNKESRALQLKLNEIVAAVDGASNHLIAAENLSEAELERLSAAYVDLARKAAERKQKGERHSVEEGNPATPAGGTETAAGGTRTAKSTR